MYAAPQNTLTPAHNEDSRSRSDWQLARKFPANSGRRHLSMSAQQRSSFMD
jgi:hypothetical protein